jgi:hypothetical protein
MVERRRVILLPSIPKEEGIMSDLGVIPPVQSGQNLALYAV